MNTVRLDPLGGREWSEVLAEFPGAGLFHSAAWARVLRDSYGYEPVYLAVRDSRRTLCVLPLMHVGSWLTGRRGISLPFSDECEPLCLDPAAFAHGVDFAIEHGKALGWKFLEIRGGRPLLEKAVPSTTFWGHRLKLDLDANVMFGKVESSVRRAVRKAGESGLEITVGRSLEDLRAFYRLLCRTRRRHGVPPQPWRFFANFHRHIISAEHGCIILARFGALPVAGAVFFHSGKSAAYKYGASDETHQLLRANNLVMWEAIKWHVQKGFSTLDFGRTSVGNEGLRRFKLGWGATERQIEYIRYDLRERRYVAARDESAGWHNRVFRRLPIFLSQIVGRAIYRHMA